MSRLAELELEEHDGVQVAHLTGELDLSNVADVGDTLAAAVSPEACGLVVDMDGLRHIDSAGVRMLFDVRRRLAQHRQDVVLAVPQQARIRDVLELTAVEMMVPVFDDVEAAVRAVREGG